MNVGKLIAQGRQAKEMSQKDLATKICEKPQVGFIYILLQDPNILLVW